ncbi:MAG: hypothetical protein R3C01_04575 [Planctomycetaceae bacterium]
MPIAAPKLSDPVVLDYGLWMIGTVVAVGVLVWTIITIRAWFGDDAGRMEYEQDLLTHLREVHGQGDLSDEEFRSIKSRIFAQSGLPPNQTKNETPATSRNTPLPSSAPQTNSPVDAAGSSIREESVE